MDANEERLSKRVIGCAFEVSNRLGAGFFEAVYENAMAVELERSGIAFVRQKRLPVTYRNVIVGDYVADMLIAEVLIVEIKALSAISTLHEAQLMNYLKASNLKVGLLLNFGKSRVGVKRIVNAYDERQPL
ncbi:GxxExxY protein [uncultured Salinisphaera sp.]|uniref:GxxExxY protein n=1 Tax=uncultured Salinisphaera sp. TaxID=359372 RepID=UPI0032B1ED6B|tara:strand:- start:162 stop:554 length:393 start_codon:yes stop_codon:yes gene_type:complete